MGEIVRGTTPTIRIQFSTVPVESLTVAILTIRQGGDVVIEKTLDDAAIEENAISWKLTQDETLSLAKRVNAVIMCDWKLADGTRGRSNISVNPIGNPGIEEVI